MNIIVKNIISVYNDIPTTVNIDESKIDLNDIQSIVQYLQDEYLDIVVSFIVNDEFYDFSDLDDHTNYEAELMPDTSHYDDIDGEWLPYRSRSNW